MRTSYLLRRDKHSRQNNLLARLPSSPIVELLRWHLDRFITPYCERLPSARHGDEGTLFIATSSAMFDEAAWPAAKTVSTERDIDRYMHFGGGMHRCFDEYINRIQLPIIVEQALSLGELTATSAMLNDGPFPDQWVLSFNAKQHAQGTL